MLSPNEREYDKIAIKFRFFSSFYFTIFSLSLYKMTKGHIYLIETYLSKKGMAHVFQDKCIEGIIYVQLSEREEKYAHFQRVHIQKYVDR